MAEQTPMMRQYLEIKSGYPDAILFFRMGDFYEMFLEDALLASRILDITLTSRTKGSADEIPFCGVPYHSVTPYIARLIEAGHKVAICEQVEDPKQAKGIVRREVVRVITPGLLIEAESLSPDENNYLLALCRGAGEQWGVAWLDLSTGEFRVTELTGTASVAAEAAGVNPREVLLSDGLEKDTLPAELRDFLAERMISRCPAWVYERDYAASLLCGQFGAASASAPAPGPLPTQPGDHRQHGRRPEGRLSAGLPGPDLYRHGCPPPQTVALLPPGRAGSDPPAAGCRGRAAGVRHSP